MTKFNLLNFAVLCMMVMSFSANAQKMLSFADPTATGTTHNFYVDYVGERVTIVSPSNIAGVLRYNIANDGNGGPNEWGGSIIANPVNNIEIAKADPYEACAPLTSAVNGKVALIKRNNCEFGAKALEAQNAGAVAVIIVNNSSGPPVGMGAGAKGTSVTIPVIMISDVDGAAIEAALGSGSVTVSMRTWNNGYNNDIGFVNGGLFLSHAASIPLTQISGSTNDIYKGFDGAVIANFGTTTANTLKVKATVTWTPGTPGNITGTGTIVHQDSVDITTPFAQTDSIVCPIFDNAYTLNPTTTGRYDVEYEVIPDFTDDFPADNKMSYSFFIDNRIYSRGRYDFNKNEPVRDIRTALAGTPTPSFLMGSMYYMDKAGYQIERVAFVTSNTDTITDMSTKSPVDIAIYSWKDANSDKLMSDDECELVGFGTHTFKAGDTSSQSHFVNITDPLDKNKPTVTEANTWYWAALSMPGDMLMGYDGLLNYYPRAWGRMHSSTPVREPYAPIFAGGNYQAFDGSGRVSMYPYDLNQFHSHSGYEDTVRFAQQKNGFVPALALQMSLFQVDVNDFVGSDAFDINIYPNPVSDVMNVNLNLEQQAKEVRYRVFNMFGSSITNIVTHQNVKSDTYTVNTAELASGTYYLAITVDGKSEIKKFTVIK